MSNMAKTGRKVAVVTGGNSGIGFATAHMLVRLGFEHIVIVCRNLKRANTAVQRLVKKTGASGAFSTLICDLSSLSSSKSAAKELLSRNLQVDFLVLNAGMLTYDTDSKTDEGFERMFATSILGHHVFAVSILDGKGFAKNARVILAGSGGATYEVMLKQLSYEKLFAHKQFEGNKEAAMDAIITNDVPWADFDLDPPSIYANVKVWSAWWAQSMAKRYDTVQFFCVDPGWVAGSNLGRNADRITRSMMTLVAWVGPCLKMSHSAEVGAQRYLDVLDFPSSENGSFWVSPEGKWSGQMKASTRDRLPWIHNEDLRKQSWDAIVKATGYGAL